MSDENRVAETFTRARPRLIRMAYAVVGSHADAEDVVSDCWLRLVTADARDPVRDVQAWATVAVARLALDTLRSARVRRESYVGPWLPEPWVDPPTATTIDPADRVTLDDSVSFALLVVLETLSPAERVAWVLHDLFGMGFPEVATIVGRTPAAVRQLATRARRHVAAGTPRTQVDTAAHRSIVTAFAAAAADGDLATLLTLLDPDVVLTSDGGGQVRAALRPVHGPDRVARLLIGAVAQLGPQQRTVPVTVNGAPGLGVLHDDGLDLVVSLTLHASRIVRVDLIAAPDKLPSRKPAAPTPTESS